MMTDSNNKTMTAADYQVAAQRTAPDVAHDKKDWLNLVTLGIVGESGELCDLLVSDFAENSNEFLQNLVKECGDVYWYIAVACEKFGIKFEQLVSSDTFLLQYVNEEHRNERVNFVASSAMTAVLAAAQISEQVKKVNYHAQELSLKDFQENLMKVVTSVRLIHLSFDISSGEVMWRNIDKLKTRYPEQFSPELSVEKRDELCKQCKGTGRIWDNGDMTHCGCTAEAKRAAELKNTRN